MLFVYGLVGECELTINAGVEAVAYGKRIMNNKIFESPTEIKYMIMCIYHLRMMSIPVIVKAMYLLKAFIIYLS